MACYAAGGVTGNVSHDKQKATDKCSIYDPEVSTWFPSAPMHHARAYAGAAAHDNCVYIVGGEDEFRRKTDTIEKFDGYYNRWSFVARMRGGPKIGLAVAEYNDHLYIVGGFNKDSPYGPIFDDVECYDILNQR